MVNASVTDVAVALVRCFRAGGKLLIAGNGGSAADAQHIAAEFIGKYQVYRDALPAIALASDAASLTAIGNDFGFMDVFRRPLSALGRRGDVFLAISTSGQSNNVLEALNLAKVMGLVTVAFTGRGGPETMTADLMVVIESYVTSEIQQEYMKFAHRVCEAVERTMFGSVEVDAA